MKCFLCQQEIYLWYLPGTTFLYSGPSPVDLACLWNHLLHAYRYLRMSLLILWLSPTGYCCREGHSSLLVLECTSSRVWFLNQYSRQVGCFTTYDIILVFICISYTTRARYFQSYSYDTYLLVVRCLKQNKDAVWSLVLLLVTGVRADPKYSYSYDIICMYVRIVTFDFSLKYFIFLVGTW